jgi:ferredoxin-NADP reductase
MKTNNLETYIVKSKKEESSEIFTFSLTTHEKNENPSFIAGQYINIYFPETDTPEGKSYSISSSPNESKSTFSITVRAIGEFSNKICSLKEGDTISGSLPYGFFGIEKEDSDIVMLASGIGITPFRSMILDVSNKNSSRKRKISLFHSIRKSSDAIFKEDFEKLENVSVHYFVTQEESSNIPDAINRRIKTEDVLEKINKDNLENTEFLICGSISFTRDMWKSLKEAGVSEDQILTEAFFS